ncbi:hypothetical protein [Crossiella cryophila]|uniref:Uncharacterized protein n=1 Tax=Crossiella cryophila TaxID=43355 RepID=A0A7W7C8W0_9PSEU|nr:hypothetical protein [Crossiella cryophila]MBB4676693.1 hypothetical protein [Crossiella cryophila]
MDQLQAMWLAKALAETSWAREQKQHRRKTTGGLRRRLFRRSGR